MENKTNNNNNNNDDDSIKKITNKIPSEKLVSTIITNGFSNMIVNTTLGLTIGTLFGIVLSRGGTIGGSTIRKCFGGFGSGIGFGSSWTQTSIYLENLLSYPAIPPVAATTTTTTTTTTEQSKQSSSETTIQKQQSTTSTPKMSSS